MITAPIYDFIYRPLPQAGGQQYAFQPKYTQPIYSLPGPGTPVQKQWAVTQPEQLYVNHASAMNGMAGVVAGQGIMQPLVDTRGITG